MGEIVERGDEMSNLQEQAIKRIGLMSDVDISFLMEIMDRLIPHSDVNKEIISDKMRSYQNLKVELDDIQKYFPKDFDPDKELEEALTEKYGSVN